MHGFGVSKEKAHSRCNWACRTSEEKINGGSLLGFYLSSWQTTLPQNPRATWPWGSHKPLSNSPHCAINLTTWHWVSKPHDLAQPTAPTWPPTAALHVPYLPIKTVFQFASSCSNTQNAFPSVPLFPNHRHPAQAMEKATCPTKAPLALPAGRNRAPAPLFWSLKSPYSASICILGAGIHISDLWLNYKIQKEWTCISFIFLYHPTL